MTKNQDHLLSEEDWRFYAIDRVGTGLGSIATEELLSDGQRVGFGLPSAPAIYLNLARNAHARRVAMPLPGLFDEHPAPQGTYPDKHGALFDFFEAATSEIVFSYSAIEATANELIPSGYIYKRRAKGSRPMIHFTANEIERKISLDEKLGRVLPAALGIATPAGKKIWQDYVNLQNLRDRLIHLKSVDRRASGPEDATIWGRLLRLGAVSGPSVAYRIIEHFYPTNRRWFQLAGEQELGGRT